MTKRDELLALAERVEALTGPDRETNARIALAAGWVCLRERTRKRHGLWGAPGYIMNDDGFCHKDPPAFTASLDAAMSLVPDGWYIDRLHQWVGDNFRWSCDLAKKDLSLACPVSVENCATPALALTAAALRALAATETDA